MEAFKRTGDDLHAGRLDRLDRTRRIGRFYAALGRREERPNAVAFRFGRALLLATEDEHVGSAAVRLDVDAEARRNG